MKEILHRTTRQNCRTIKKKGRTTRQNCRTTRQNCRTIKKNVSKISKGGGGSVVEGKIVTNDEPLFGKATFTKDPNDSQKKKVIYEKKTITLEQFRGMTTKKKKRIVSKLTGVTTK